MVYPVWNAWMYPNLKFTHFIYVVLQRNLYSFYVDLLREPYSFYVGFLRVLYLFYFGLLREIYSFYVGLLREIYSFTLVSRKIFTNFTLVFWEIFTSLTSVSWENFTHFTSIGMSPLYWSPLLYESTTCQIEYARWLVEQVRILYSVIDYNEVYIAISSCTLDVPKTCMGKLSVISEKTSKQRALL